VAFYLFDLVVGHLVQHCALLNEKVRANIPIIIRRVIIHIPIERACISAITRITADMDD
jgi:hypothetical protein